MLLDIAQDYLDNHGDNLLDAAEAFTLALIGGDPTKEGGYSLDNAILATIDAFQLTPRDTILLTTRLAVRAVE